MSFGAVIGAGASLLGASKQASAAKDATRAQTRAAEQQIALSRETRDLIRSDLAPYVQSGTLGQQAYLSTLGLASAPMIGGTAPQVQVIPGTAAVPASSGNALGDQWGGDHGRGGSFRPSTPGTAATPERYSVNGQSFDTRQAADAYAQANLTGGTQWGGFQKSPGYDFQLQQGLEGLQSTAAARGGLYSGAAMQAAQTYGQGLANQEYGNFQNRLASLGSAGQAAAGMQADANTNYAQMGNNALASIGNAQSAGAIAQGNAWNTGIGNALGAWQYQNQLQPQAGRSNQLFSGNSWG